MRWQRFCLFLSVFTVAACSSPPPGNPPLSFAKYQPIYMAVSNIEIVPEYKSPMQSPYVEHLMPYSPTEAMQIWVRDRLKTTGGEKSMKIVIKDGSVKAYELPSGTTGVKGFFSIGQTRRYDANLSVEMRVYGASPIATANVEANAHRSITLPEDASVSERDTAFRKLIADLMADLNAELEKDIYQYMSNEISYSHNP